MEDWDAFPDAPSDAWDAFPDAPASEAPRKPKAQPPAKPKGIASNLPPFDVGKINVRSSGGLPVPAQPQATRPQLGAPARPATPNPVVVVQPGDYELKLDRALDFSPPTGAMTNVQQRQYLQLVNDPKVDRAQLTAWLNGFGRTVDDAMWQEVEAGRKSGKPFAAVRSPDERFAGMVDKEALGREYAPEREDFWAQVGRGAMDGWSQPASLMNALDRAKLDYFDVYKERVRQQFPGATPEQINRLEDDFIAHMARLRAKAASEGVKNDGLGAWLLGQLVSVEPYDALPLGRAARAETLMGRFAEKGLQGAKIAAVGDVSGQSLAIKDGAQDKYDPLRTAASIVLSGTLSGGLGVAGALRPRKTPDAPPPDARAPQAGADGGEGAAPSTGELLARSLTPANDEGAALARPRPLLEPTSRADLLASASRIRPGDMLPRAANAVDEADLAKIDKGRFAEAKPVDERSGLIRGKVINWRGEPVPKVGPLDMIGWLRTQGGLQDQGGELATLGLTNAARRGLDHVGQETRFGPLVDPEGLSLDDAALRAWEAGYFPELRERPDINTFLDAVRSTYNGETGRRFLPEDMADVERFDAMRAERYDLERMRAENDGPIFNDRSVPAGSERPYPPVEAYEEWPAAAIGKVGNIDVKRLETPQDIGRVLRETHNTLGGFDAATRGRIASAETERLASELNMSVAQLLARRKGQAFNAEEALAARQLLAKSGNELVNAARRISRLDDPGDELLAGFRQAWMRHVAIQEQVAGITAEAGRVLNQFKMAANSRAVRGDILSAFVRSGGGRDDLKEAAEALIDAIEVGPGHFNAIAEKAAKPKWRDKISELYINSLLSNPPTHVVNMVSNSLTMVSQIPEHAFASAIGGARRAVLGEKAGERILGSEVGARAFGLIQGVKEGASLFYRTLKTGEPDDFVSKVEGDQYRAISGVKGEIIRIPTRLLTAEDQLFKGIARRMELNAEAVRIAHREGLTGAARKERIAELVANPTDNMLARALDYGRYATFQRQLGGFGQGLSRITNDSLPAKIVVPFVRTPINLLKFATERSPAAPLLKEWRADFAAGGEKRDLAIARAVIGSGFAALFFQFAQDGAITGAVPPDTAKARLMYADGWQPYSVKIGDRYVSYSRLDPFATVMGVAADMATLPGGLSDRQKEDQATMLVASIMGNLANKTWLSGVSSLVEGLSDPQRRAENWLERTVGAFAVPAGVAGLARSLDPVARKREGVVEAIMSRIPGLSDDLHPRRDVFGEPVPLDSLGPDFISPFWQTKAKNDPVVAEMLRLGKSIAPPSKQYVQDGERLDYSPERYDRYHELAGRFTYNGLLALVGSSEYSSMDDRARAKAAGKVIAESRKSARRLLDDPSYPVPPRGSSLGFDPWSDFPGGDGGAPAAKPSADPWGDFPDAPQRDVTGALRSAIPGVGITSGYRTPAYQEDMRRRGYTPATNSAHLTGSALDLVPPRGMSMRQLMDRVRAVEPSARMLAEGDHLHVTFPDWQGAPAIGGAAAAGVRNPVR